MGYNPRDHLIQQPIAGTIDLPVTGTYYRNGTDILSDQGFYIRANPGNSGNVYLGNTGAIYDDKYGLDAGQESHVNIYNVRGIQFVGDSAGDSVHWLKKGVD